MLPIPIPSAVGTFNKTKDLFEISNQLRYVELFEFRCQDELKVRKAPLLALFAWLLPLLDL
jgi:hypothetical protein